MKRISVLASIAALCFIGGARADDARNPLDDNFLVKVSTCENAEIETAKLADKRAQSAKVKEFASQMLQDHRKSYDKVAAVIKNRKIAVVAGFEKDAKAEIDRLSKLQGAEFDREFMECVIKDHKNAIAMFEHQANEGKDADTKNFAKETLPTLKEHLKMAQEIAKSPQQ